MKQCPNCRNNLADYVPTCPFCGKAVAVTPMAGGQPAWSGAREESGKATASLVCGILFFFWPSALAAVILGHIAIGNQEKCGTLGRTRASGGRIGAGLCRVGVYSFHFDYFSDCHSQSVEVSNGGKRSECGGEFANV